MSLYLYGGIALVVAFLGLFGWGSYEKHRADAAVANVQQWKEAAVAAEKERDAARTELNQSTKQITQKYQTDLKGVANERDKALARLNALSLPVSSSGCASGAKQSETPANTSRVTATTRSELSRADAGFLIAYAAEADEVTVERNTAVSLLVSCRQTLEAP